MSDDPLALIEAHLAVVEALTMTDEGELPAPPDLSAFVLEQGDLERARVLLAGLEAAGDRIAGMTVRIRGEIQGLRRPRRETLRPAPRVLDTSA
jgi:hypothetical protein